MMGRNKRYGSAASEILCSDPDQEESVLGE